MIEYTRKYGEKWKETKPEKEDKMTDVTQERITLAQTLITIPQVKKTLRMHLCVLIDKYDKRAHAAYAARLFDFAMWDVNFKRTLINLLRQIDEDDIAVDELYRHYLVLVCGDGFVYAR